ncbi:MAG: molybdopterin-dependent oxidoreductase [Calditrichaeota bacterium]|nr:molybdopterin-dependent oxidoreductase [Calditrichota bacterium]MCB9070590.1 molybdopterin-dependent oxidoreductase [Calditrichia bacterium]
MKRRDFLKFIGMASSATVLTSCGVEKSTEKIIPLLVPHTEPDYLPGEPMFRNSVCTECSAGCGAEVRLVEFNAVKLDGIKGHPLNDGALCLRGQSSLMRLYHPERLKTPMLQKRNMTELERMQGSAFEVVTWAKAYEVIAEQLNQSNNSGKQNVYLSGKVSGSTAALLSDFMNATGTAHVSYETYTHANLRKANEVVFGRNEIPAYQIDKSDLLISIGADMIETFVNPVSNSVQLEKARKNNNLKWMHIEPHASLSGFKANHTLKVKPGSEGYLLAFLLGNFSGGNALPAGIAEQLPSVNAGKATQETGLSADQLNEIVSAMRNARNPLLVVGGVSTEQPGGLSVALLATLLQAASGMINNTIDFSHSVANTAGTAKDLENLARQLKANQVGVLFVSNTDPMSNAPASTGIAEAISNAGFRVAFSDFMNETTKNCDLVLPLSHTFETWQDIEVRQGLTAFSKPVLKEKLFDTRSEGEALFELSQKIKGGETTATYADWIQQRWSTRFGAENVEGVLQAGFSYDKTNTVSVAVQRNAVISAMASLKMASAVSGATAYVMPSIRAFDGRSSVLPLAYEIPDPLTTISYGQWISMSKEDAEEMNIHDTDLVIKMRDVLTVSSNGASKDFANFVQPGLQKNVFTLQRDQVGADMLTFDTETGECISRLDGVQISNAGTKRSLSIMAGSMEQGHRNIVREEHPHEIPWLKGDETLYPDMNEYYPTYRWGISVDMESCIGCSACVAACYIENNIPVVGESEHLKGREMSWLRIQPYYFEDGSMDTLVMMCQQCDYAPCENVCPVYATYHNEEGLNVMVYNRCVGTRYCHNNCPYKVRRFNWFDWTDQGAWAEPMTRMVNPDVWVRPKGVMEKCTFCVQRIRRGKDRAKDEGRTVRDGEIRTACQDACPTDAITFGNMKDENAMVYKKSQSNRKFRVLEVLGVGPAVHYLRKEEQA